MCLNTLYIRRDNVPTVLLASWPLEANLWDGEILSGPVPSLFSTDVKASEDGLRDSPDRAHADMARLSRMFFMAEHVNLQGAYSVLKKPR